MASELGELTGFLLDKRADVRGMAVDIIQGLTASPEGVEQLKGQLLPLASNLLKLCSDAAADVSSKALNSLVNLSQDEAVTAVLLEQGAVSKSLDILRDSACQHPKLLAMLLANLTLQEQGCKDLLQVGQGALEGLNMALLLGRFLSKPTPASEDEDTYAHIALVLLNVTRLKEARLILTQPGRGLLASLGAQIGAPAPMRRIGSVGALRNCIMSAEDDGTLDAILGEKDMLAALLGPINGKEPKESEEAVREQAAEAVMMLSLSDKGRDVLWEIGAPEALRKGYEDEQHPGICSAMEKAAEMFLTNSVIDSSLPTRPKSVASG